MRVVRSSVSSRRTRSGRDDVDRGDDPFDLAADVGEVPGRPALGQTCQGQGADRVPVDGADRCRFERHRARGWGEAELDQLRYPASRQVRPLGGHDLVGSRLRPRPPVPSPAQRWARFLVRVFITPPSLVPVDVPGDLRGPGAERPRVRGELADLRGVRVEDVAVGGEDLPELRVARHRGVADAVDGSDRVDHADRVQSPPPSGGEDPGIDLQMQMTVRVTGPRGVVPHHRRLQLLHGYLHLPAAGTHPGGRVLGQPPDDLDRGPLLGGVEGVRDLRVEGRGQGPGLRSVDHDLHEPQRPVIGTQSTLRLPGDRVKSGDPPLIGRPVEPVHQRHGRAPAVR